MWPFRAKSKLSVACCRHIIEITLCSELTLNSINIAIDEILADLHKMAEARGEDGELSAELIADLSAKQWPKMIGGVGDNVTTIFK